MQQSTYYYIYQHNQLGKAVPMRPQTIQNDQKRKILKIFGYIFWLEKCMANYPIRPRKLQNSFEQGMGRNNKGLLLAHYVTPIPLLHNNH